MAFSASSLNADGGTCRDPISDGLHKIPDIKLQTLTHLTDYLTDIKTLPNPLDKNPFFHPLSEFYITQTDVILRHILHDLSGAFPSTAPNLSYHRAGPRKEIFFDPVGVRAAIVTCGGLCPGMNTVIRELVVGLWDLYGVREIYGVRAGYRGFYSTEPVALNPKMVHDWHRKGGTVLETSRGGFDLNKIVDAIEALGFNQFRSLGGQPSRCSGLVPVMISHPQCANCNQACEHPKINGRVVLINCRKREGRSFHHFLVFICLFEVIDHFPIGLNRCC